MATLGTTSKPAYVYDTETDTWVPIGVGAHTHALTSADVSGVVAQSGYFAAGKNKIINGDFAINQRNFTSLTCSGSDQYGFDRWLAVSNTGTVTYSTQSFTAGTAPVVGYEANSFARIVTSGQSTSSAYAIIAQKIEDVRTYANQSVTVSFWAKAATGTPKIAIEISQGFGNSGSSQVNTYAGQATISTSWNRYSVTATVPSISGKTIGANSLLSLNLWVSGGTAFNSRTGSMDIQSGTFDIWGVQIESGSTMTSFQTATGNPASELAACQRYYWRNSGAVYNPMGPVGYTTASTTANGYMILPVTMRVTPTSVDFANLTWRQINALGYTVTGITLSSVSTNKVIRADVAVSGGGMTSNIWGFLETDGYLNGVFGISAEL
jgi:hypothetical protein